MTTATKVRFLIEAPGTIELMAPLHHGGDEKTGSIPLLRTITIYDPGQGRHVRLPFISGNAIRGQLRRLLIRDTLERLGYELSSKTVYHALYSGGVLEQVEGERQGVLDVELRRRIRQDFPPLALFGCALGNQNIDGSLQVEHAFPVCSEYSAYLREELLADPRAQMPIRTFQDFTFFTRRDERVYERQQDEQAVQMLVELEVLVPGTLFQHGFALVWASALEASALSHVLDLWTGHLALGGRSASGFGRARASYDREQLPPATIYLEFVHRQGKRMREFLSELEDRFS